jgi:acyl-CoA thioester hydrolase
MVEGAVARTHITPIRVYYEDTDAGGIVYYANYLKFAERARTEMMRDLSGGHYGQMLANGMGFVVRRCIVDYMKPAMLDDLLEVHSRALHVGAASLSAEQIVRRDGEQLVGIEVKLGCVDAQGRPARMPAELRKTIGQFL